MRLSTILTFLTAALVIVALPATIFLTNRQQTYSTNASGDASFSVPPTISMNVGNVGAGGTLISTNTENSNWYAIYFAEEIPPLALFTSKDNINSALMSGQLEKVYEAGQPTEFTFTPTKPGKLFAMVYQRANYTGDIQAGDVLCSWDGNLYVYERKRQNIVKEMLNFTEEEPGVWHNLGICENSGPIDVGNTQ